MLSAGWSSLAARRAHNPKVVGSNPAPATRFLRYGAPYWGFLLNIPGKIWEYGSGPRAHFLFGYFVVLGLKVKNEVILECVRQL